MFPGCPYSVIVEDLSRTRSILSTIDNILDRQLMHLDGDDVTASGGSDGVSASTSGGGDGVSTSTSGGSDGVSASTPGGSDGVSASTSGGSDGVSASTSSVSAFASGDASPILNSTDAAVTSSTENVNVSTDIPDSLQQTNSKVIEDPTRKVSCIEAPSGNKSGSLVPASEGGSKSSPVKGEAAFNSQVLHSYLSDVCQLVTGISSSPMEMSSTPTEMSVSSAIMSDSSGEVSVASTEISSASTEMYDGAPIHEMSSS